MATADLTVAAAAQATDRMAFDADKNGLVDLPGVGNAVAGIPLGIGRSGFMLLDKLAKRVHALGVEVRFQTRARALVVDEQDRVCGVVVVTDDARWTSL